MRSVKIWLNNYFSFTKREFDGLLVLAVLIALISVAPYPYAWFFSKQQMANELELQAIQKLTLRADKQDHRVHTPQVVHTSLFEFDPNQISLREWQELGLSAKQAQSIINYRNKGGKFYRPEDLKKMYTISSQMYKRLYPYIVIETKSVAMSPTLAVKADWDKKPTMVNVNLADSAMLDGIKGIGPVFASRILKYRKRLGGFYQKEQLREVYGIDSAKYEEIKTQILIDASVIVKININTANFDDLRQHPYLKFKEINAIIQYRKQHGNYGDIDDLKKVLILSPQTMMALKPYLIF
ncbi:comEA protein [compost metagenome]